MRRNVHNSDLYLTPVDGNAVRVTNFKMMERGAIKRKTQKKAD